MNFVSLDFLVFFIVFYLGYWLLPARFRPPTLLIASYIFYAWWDWRFLGLIAFATSVGYVCGQRIHAATDPTARRRWLVLSIVVSLLVLGYFKYAGFFVSSATSLLNRLGLQADPLALHIVLPVGISFFTFEVLTYTIDIYRREIKPTRSPLVFASFLAFFPHLVAGPIVRARELLTQLEQPKGFSVSDLEHGALRFLIGFFKKAVIADNLALMIVDPVFAAPGHYDQATTLLAVLAYSAQIYADFSGYTDMALGAARMLGFQLPENFRFPYLARSIPEFWTRWHMTMSRFFRDYIYIPLGGNRRGALRAALNGTATTLLSGLWHGASWTFASWGALHGFGIMVANLLGALGLKTDTTITAVRITRALLAWFSTFVFVSALWILFRAADFHNALLIFQRCLTADDGTSFSVPLLVWFSIAAVALEHGYGFMMEYRPTLARPLPALAQGLFYALLLVLIVNLKPANPNPFIYFQF